MQFWIIESHKFGRFCGYKRKAKDYWMKRPIFGRLDFHYSGNIMLFANDQQAYRYIRSHHTLPFDCTPRLCALNNEGHIYYVNEV